MVVYISSKMAPEGPVMVSECLKVVSKSDSESIVEIKKRTQHFFSNSIGEIGNW
jgi:hypothetical protein